MPIADLFDGFASLRNALAHLHGLFHGIGPLVRPQHRLNLQALRGRPLRGNIKAGFLFVPFIVQLGMGSNQAAKVYATVSGITAPSKRASRTNCPTHGVWH